MHPLIRTIKRFNSWDLVTSCCLCMPIRIFSCGIQLLAFDRLRDGRGTIEFVLDFAMTPLVMSTRPFLRLLIRLLVMEVNLLWLVESRKSWIVIHFPYRVHTLNLGPIVNENLHRYASKNDSGNYFLSPHKIIYFDAQRDKFEDRGTDARS